MTAELVLDFKDVTPEGGVIQMRVRRVPEPVPPSGQRFKSSLYHGLDGKRIVGFDHQRGKGDHRRLDAGKTPCAFVRLKQLVEDFIAEVEKRRD
jgi:hypothetical protein